MDSEAVSQSPQAVEVIAQSLAFQSLCGFRRAIFAWAGAERSSANSESPERNQGSWCRLKKEE